VLVVDDDESVRNAVALMAEVLGFRAITAADGDTSSRLG
jgi:FixJ family two-component response regulator